MATEGRKRGRPPRSPEARAKTRAQIEAAALDLYRREGYGAVSMRRLAEAAGCSPMALYDYFANKIDVLRSLWAQVFAELFAQLEPAASTPEPRARLARLATGYVAYWRANTENYRMVFMAEGVTQPEVSAFVDGAAMTERFSIFVQTLTEARPDLDSGDLKLRSDFLLCALHGIAHCHITIAGFAWTDAEALAKHAVRAALDGDGA